MNVQGSNLNSHIKSILLSSFYSAQVKASKYCTFFLLTTNGYLTWKAFLDHNRIQEGPNKEALWPVLREDDIEKTKQRVWQGQALTQERTVRKMEEQLILQLSTNTDLLGKICFLHELVILLSRRLPAKSSPNPAEKYQNTSLVSPTHI